MTRQTASFLLILAFPLEAGPLGPSLPKLMHSASTHAPTPSTSFRSSFLPTGGGFCRRRLTSRSSCGTGSRALSSPTSGRMWGPCTRWVLISVEKEARHLMGAGGFPLPSAPSPPPPADCMIIGLAHVWLVPAALLPISISSPPLSPPPSLPCRLHGHRSHACLFGPCCIASSQLPHHRSPLRPLSPPCRLHGHQTRACLSAAAKTAHSRCGGRWRSAGEASHSIDRFRAQHNCCLSPSSMR